MNITILGQGIYPSTDIAVGNKLIKLLADNSFHTFTSISAFTSLAGIHGLSTHLEKAKGYLKEVVIITGVDQKGTSKEALEELLALNVHSYVFYQPGVTIFHPKIYLFEGKQNAELIIGSSNLTANGLFTNVEASLLVSIDLAIEADQKLLNELKTYFKGVFELSDPNLKKLSLALINDLVQAKIVPTEEERKAVQDKQVKADSDKSQKLAKIFPKRTLPKAPAEFVAKRRASKGSDLPIRPASSVKGELLWESGSLTQRDLNIPKGTNTNPTGSMLFKKGKMQNIDQRHYFRDTVFAGLKWRRDPKPEIAHLEERRPFSILKLMVRNWVNSNLS